MVPVSVPNVGMVNSALVNASPNKKAVVVNRVSQPFKRIGRQGPVSGYNYHYTARHIGAEVFQFQSVALPGDWHEASAPGGHTVRSCYTS